MSNKKRDRFRNSDLIFFGTMFVAIGGILFMVFTDINITYFTLYWMIPLSIVIFPKFLYAFGIRTKLVNKCVDWLESTNNFVDNWIKKKLGY